MKLIIDIDENLLEGIKSDDFGFARQVVKNFQGTIASAIANGTPIPDNATNGEWVDVNERLPEDRQEILFSTKTDRVHHGRYYLDKTCQNWYSFKDELFANDNVVTAWMPLPKPYQKGGKE